MDRAVSVGRTSPRRQLGRVAFAHTEVKGKGLVVGPPKSRAGVRTVAVPAAVRADLLAHLDEYTNADQDALVFTGVPGRALRRGPGASG